MFKFKNIEISDHKFIFILSLYLAYFFNFSFFKILFLNFNVSSFYQLISFILLFIVIPLPIIVLLNIILVKYTIKALSCVILITSAVSNYIMFTTGAILDVDMIRNVFETNTREALDFVSVPILIYLIVFAIVPSILIYKIKINFSSLKKELIRRSLIILGSISLVLVYFFTFSKVVVPFVRNNPSIRSSYNTLNYIVNISRYVKARITVPSEFIIIDDSPKSAILNPSNVHVSILIIGETARLKNFSLYGYDRETNPLLKNIKNLLVLKDPVSCGTSTAISVPCIFSSKTRKDFKVDLAKYEENVLDLIQKAGWKILWYENDNGCKNVCSRVDTYDVVKIGHKDYCFEDYCYDEVLIPHVKDILKNIKNENTLIVIHSMGSHGPSYYKRYPDNFLRFTPTCNTAEVQNCSREELVNTYDNTIVYTDYVVSSIIKELEQYKDYESSLIYVSDHGESLSENGLYLHGMPYSIAPKEQIYVPFLIWFSDKILKDSSIDFKCLKENEDSVSHDNIFHTMLGITETDSKVYDKNLDIISKCKHKTK